MKTSSIIKIILIIFFIIFFGFLFYYFYDPSGTKEITKTEKNSNNVNVFSVLPFNKIKNVFFGDDKPTQIDKSVIKELDKSKKDELVFDMPTLRQLTNIPTAGLIIEPISKIEIFDINKNLDRDHQLKEDGKYWEIRYIATKNNHVYRKYNFSLKEERIANVTIPKIRSVHFFDKNNYIITYLNNENVLKTYSVQLSKKEPDELQRNLEDEKKSLLKNFRGIFFPDNILSLKVNKKTKEVFYLIDSYAGGSIGFLSDSKNSKIKQVSRLPLKEWNFYWIDKNKLLFITLPSYVTESLSFSLDLNNNRFTKINYPVVAGNLLPNSDGSKVLYSGYRNKHFRLFSISGKERKTSLFSLRTFTDKCVWSKDNIFAYCAEPSYVGDFQPDQWYKGKKYFADKIFALNTDTNEVIEIFTPKDDSEVFDIVDITLDPEEKFLYFKDKKTDFYWSLDLEQVAEERRKFLEERQRLINNLTG